MCFPLDCRVFYPDGNICPVGVPECAADLPDIQRKINSKDLTRDYPPPLTDCEVTCLVSTYTCGLSGIIGDTICSSIAYELCEKVCKKLTCEEE